MTATCAVVALNCAKNGQDAAVIRSVLEETLKNIQQPDFIVFCLQEVATILDASMGWVDEWIAPFKRAVPQNYKYVGQSVSGACAVVAFATSFNLFSSLYYDTSAFGVLWSSAKGAALLSLTLPEGEGKLTFVSVHFCANEGYKEQRNQDFNYMLEDLGIAALDGQVFIAGDMNYRTSDGTLATDELTEEMRSGKAGKGFSESPISFEPTFKYRVRSNDYDTKRIASYCDRVLYRNLEGTKVFKYDSVMSTELNSDHKPVYLAVSTPTKTIKTPTGWKSAEDEDAAASRSHHMAYAQLANVAAILNENEEDGNTAPSHEVKPPAPKSLRTSEGLLRWVTLAADTFIGLALYSLSTTRGRIMLACLMILLVLSRI